MAGQVARTVGRVLEGLVRFASVISGIALVLMMLQIAADVATRNLFNTTLFGTAIFVAYYHMVLVTFLPLAMAEWLDGHIRVDVVFDLLPQRLQVVVMIAVRLFAAAICFFVAWHTFGEGMKKWGIGTLMVERDVPLPTWPAYFAIPLGFALFGAVLIWRMFTASPPAAGSGIPERPTDLAT